MTTTSDHAGPERADDDPELRELERLLDAESYTPSGNWTVRLPEKQVQWSHENHLIHGTNPESFVPTPQGVLELTHPKDRPRMQAMSDAWQQYGKPFGMLARIVRPSGEVRVIELRGWVSRDGDGNVVGAQGTTTDVTTRLAARRKRIALSKQRDVISAQQRGLLKALVAAEENERARIAADLHEDTLQTLSAVSLRLSQATAAPMNETVARTLGNAEHHVRAAATRMRFLLFELLPPVTETNLRTAVEAYCKLLFSNTDITYEVSGNPQDVPVESYLLAYRLIQGAVRKVLKHSKGPLVQVGLDADDMTLTAHIRDDSASVDADAWALASDGSLGLMRRAQAVEGSAEIHTSTPSGGVLITLHLPLRFTTPPT